MSNDEPRLLELLRAGDETAQRELWKTHYSRIFGYVLASLVRKKSREDAEEITSETFRRVFKDIGSFRGDCTLKTWICRIAQNTAKDHYRKKKNEYAFHHPETHLAITEEVVENEAYQAGSDKSVLDDLDDKRTLTSFLDELETQQFLVVSMRVLQGYSVKETSEILSITEAAVKMTLYRAMGKLRDLAVTSQRNSNASLRKRGSHE